MSDKNNPTMVRQGDVLLIKETRKYKQYTWDDLDRTFDTRWGATRPASDAIQHDRCVLASGELTGHDHTIRTLDGQKVESRTVYSRNPFSLEQGTYLNVPSEAVVEHPEHENITIDPGIWRVVRQREFDPQRALASRTVRD